MVFSKPLSRCLHTTLRNRLLTTFPAVKEEPIESIRARFSSPEFRSLGSIKLEKDSEKGLAFVQISNPKRKNSFSAQMMSQLSHVLRELQDWKQGKAVLVFGSDQFFCSGGDLETVRRIADPENGRRMSALMQDNLWRLQELPMVSVCLIEGMALGGGAELSTACDYRLMTRESRLGFVHVKLGIVSAWGGGTRLSHLIGPTRALDLMLRAKILTAEECLSLGLCSDIVGASGKGALESAVSWMDWLSLLDSKLIGCVKGIVNGAQTLDLESALKQELEYSVSVWGEARHQMALNANIKHNSFNDN